MTTITREQFNSMPQQNGGDLWNQYKLARLAFAKFKDAQKITYSIGTGLWVDVSYQTKSGETKTGTVYDSDDARVL